MNAVKILESLLKNNATKSRRLDDLAKGGGGGGGLADILGSLLGGAAPAGGGRPSMRQAQDPRIRGFEGLIGGMTSGRQAPPRAEPVPEPPRETQECAALLISAMCHAAKVDGKLDAAEKEAIIGRLGQVSRDEMDFVQRELNSPVDIDGFTRSVPRALAPQVYAFSAMAIKLDTLQEAAYLGGLAQGLGLDGAACNRIHQQVGAPPIFA